MDLMIAGLQKSARVEAGCSTSAWGNNWVTLPLASWLDARLIAHKGSIVAKPKEVKTGSRNSGQIWHNILCRSMPRNGLFRQ
jgi:hypothetical protein